MKKILLSTVMCLLSVVGFAQVEYADIVLDATFSGNGGNGFTDWYGQTTTGGCDEYGTTPEAALGDNDDFVSLPTGSILTLGFTDNAIFNAPNQNDIFIEEIGGASELADIFVSSDGVNFVYFGMIDGGTVNEIDLEDIGFTGLVTAIRIIGLDAGGCVPGFDVVSVYGLPGASCTANALTEGPSGPICYADLPVDLIQYVVGNPNGNWSGTGVNNNSFDLAQEGDYELQYIVTDPSIPACPADTSYITITISECIILGCIDANACNFDAGANTDDGSCNLPDCNGVCDGDNTGPTVAGASCDDGDACTTNDQIQADCGCAGTFADADGDGVCDNDDMCPDFDDNLNGTACDDGDACTVGDTYVDCDCVGTFADADGDTVCDADDMCPGFDDLLNGTACDDGNDCTTGDMYVDCECTGTFTDSDNDGVCDADDICNGGPEPGTACDDGDACTVGDEIQADCGCAGTFADADGDTVCDADDVCADFDDLLLGTACDDGDACTINDMYVDCECTGTFEDTDGDGICNNDDSCPDLDNALIGTTCDDGDANTEDDLYTDACVCEGTPICMGQLGTLELDREGALSAVDTEVPNDEGLAIFTWYNNATNEIVAMFIGNPYYSPSELGSYYVVVTHPNYDCFQILGPRAITELNGCCELED